MKQRILPFLSAILAAFTGGCSGTGPAPSEESVSSTLEELSRACGAASVKPDIVRNDSLNFETTTTYSNAGCWRAVVGDVIEINDHMIDPTRVNNGWIDVLYIDKDLTTSAACADALVGGYIFEKQGSSWVPVHFFDKRGGSWSSSGCFGPYIVVTATDLMFPGRDYRFAVTARRISSNATRRLKFDMMPANDIVR